jgi:hypothetical protein
MKRAGITGHRHLGDEGTSNWVRKSLLAAIHSEAIQIGVTSLAAGADQLFAECLLQESREFEAIIPCTGYEGTFDQAEHVCTYRELLRKAANVSTLPFPSPSEAAFLAAGIAVAERSQVLFAVWDGKPAAGLGGTADIVRYAKQRQQRVVQIDLLLKMVREIS